jgi:hypothetical protein
VTPPRYLGPPVHGTDTTHDPWRAVVPVTVPRLGSLSEQALAELTQHIAMQPVDANRITGLSTAQVMLFRDAVSTSNTTGYADLVTSAAIMPWDGATIPQFQVIVLAMTGAAVAVTMTAALTLASQNAGGAEGSYGTEFAATSVNLTDTSPHLIASGWVSPPTMPTPASYLNVKIRGLSSNTTNAKTWDSMQVLVTQ